MTEALVTSRRQLAIFVEDRCRMLGLRCSCPFVVSDGSKGELEFAAFLPQFGGSRGLLVDVLMEPTFAPSENHKAVAARHNIPISFVNPATLLEDANEFIAALRDWGYRGCPEELSENAKALLLASTQ